MAAEAKDDDVHGRGVVLCVHAAPCPMVVPVRDSALRINWSSRRLPGTPISRSISCPWASNTMIVGMLMTLNAVATLGLSSTFTRPNRVCVEQRVQLLARSTPWRPEVDDGHRLVQRRVEGTVDKVGDHTGGGCVLDGRAARAVALEVGVP